MGPLGSRVNGGPKIPPPTVSWSTPEGMPPPWLGVQSPGCLPVTPPPFAPPSLSLNADRLSWPVNCETKVRLVKRSVKRIASRLTVEVVIKLTSFQLAVAAEVQSLKLTCSVVRPAWYMTFLVFQSTPQEGSPPLTPFGFG